MLCGLNGLDPQIRPRGHYATLFKTVYLQTQHTKKIGNVTIEPPSFAVSYICMQYVYNQIHYVHKYVDTAIVILGHSPFPLSWCLITFTVPRLSSRPPQLCRCGRRRDVDFVFIAVDDLHHSHHCESDMYTYRLSWRENQCGRSSASGAAASPKPKETVVTVATRPHRGRAYFSLQSQ